jgi:shikimate dehydrogenase
MRQLYGLVGFPVRHSLSPLMHNAAFRVLGLDAEYRLFALKEPQLRSFFEKLDQENIHGLNITVPYKEKVLPLLDEVSIEAKLIGAVNTIKVNAAGLRGFNTDGEGFLRYLKEDLGFEPRDKAIVLLGAGGAARAVAVSLCQCAPRLLAIYDTDKEKALALSGHLQANFRDIEIAAANSLADLAIAESDLLINATPVGLKETDPPLLDDDLLRPGLLVYDLIYNPPETRLLKSARSKGCRRANGLGMLLYQGMRSFELWTGLSAPEEVMRRALEEGVRGLC